MSESISHPLITAQLATGRIRDYQLVVGGLQMLNFPLSYLFLRLGAIPETVMIVAIALSQLCFLSRLYMLRSMIRLRPFDYLYKVYFNVIGVTLLSMVLPGLLRLLLPEDNFFHFFIITIVCLVSTIFVILFVGCSASERKFVYSKVSKLIMNFKS
jgi:uncharacterized membrane protein YwaF